VIGRVVVDGAPEPPVDWTKNQPVSIHVPRDELTDSLDCREVGWHLDKDGRFHIENVPPGKYELDVTLSADSYPRVRGAEAMIGVVRTPVTVPEASAGRLDDPLNLGTITAELFDTLQVGNRAPNFTVARLVGKGRGDQLRLGDYQGKLVLLDYWATWCGPCRAEMPAIKDIYWPGLPEVPGGGGFLGAPAAFFLVPVIIMSGPLNPQRDFRMTTGTQHDHPSRNLQSLSIVGYCNLGYDEVTKCVSHWGGKGKASAAQRPITVPLGVEPSRSAHAHDRSLPPPWKGPPPRGCARLPPPPGDRSARRQRAFLDRATRPPDS
jgi:thiol-disulfide isomerase/thioredoxin